MMTIPHLLSFEGILNARDLGNYTGADGRPIRKGKLLRTALLHDATDSDLARMKEMYDVRLVIDLRTLHERTRTPDRMLPGASFVSIEVVNTNGNLYKNMLPLPGDTMTADEKLLHFLFSPAAEMLTDGFYISFIDDPYCQAQYREFMQRVVQTEEGTILWHCSQGKDRTGLAAIFLLHALGASRETLMTDFNYSKVAFANDLTRISGLVRQAGGSEAIIDMVEGLFSVNSRWMEDCLRHIDTAYGGLDAYLYNQLHVTEADKQLLRARYLKAM